MSVATRIQKTSCEGSALAPTAALRLRVRGRVQGVGFRPYVVRLARQCGLNGCVRNALDGVVIDLEGLIVDLADFHNRLVAEQPAAAAIEGVTSEPLTPSGVGNFTIQSSDASEQPLVRVPPDAVTCPECRHEIFDSANRRRGYAFTTCTTCGPRFSIITEMPFDRPSTAMQRFRMCAQCTHEYHTTEDRRLHAQSNACAACGPKMDLWDRHGQPIATSEAAIDATVELLRHGQILAVKGLGGFQLLVRADQSDAVARLRQRKHRPSKPFAVMVASLADAERFAHLTPLERRLLESQEGQIVLVASKMMLCPEVAPGTTTIGIFLPTTPLHHLLLHRLQLPIVATSGNCSDEPIVTDESAALSQLGEIADAFLVHDRPIVRRVDDSVVRVIAGQPINFRLARGYSPLPLPSLEKQARRTGCPPILALGGHQKVALALWTGAQAVLTQHIGDLDSPATRTAFNEAATDLLQLYRCKPSVLVCDLHPDYFTTRWAAESGLSVVQVQHHHAHAVASMVEHDLLDREVMALTWDGTGFGPDGTIWGGEILRAKQIGFERIGSLSPLPLPGGDAAIRHPARIAFGILWQLFGNEALRRTDVLKRLGLGPREVGLLTTMLQKKVCIAWTSSVGRLFDAVAALVLGNRVVSYEGEAAISLESAADLSVAEAYPLPDGNWQPLLTALLDDLRKDVAPGTIAARFHNALARWAGAAIRQQPMNDVVLSGGCFQNRLLAERTLDEIRRAGRKGYLPSMVPPGDGGLAVGQLAVAMANFKS